uniref:Threonine-rich protein n=1 Tax=Lygus hesperus TaxID=30085 RepID=A0A0A9ZC10_LYGHE
MLQHSCKYLVFGWHTRSLFFILAVLSNGELQQERERLQENDNRVNPAYLNPDLYREGIASLVNAKERAEEMMFKNDLIAQLVTEMPYHEIQNRLLISGNHKEVNRSFFENLNLKDARSGNCGRFDVYRLLDMVQKSRERAMLETTTSTCGVESEGDSIASAMKNIPIDELTVDTTTNMATSSGPEEPFDWFRLAEASKQLLEQKAIAAKPRITTIHIASNVPRVNRTPPNTLEDSFTQEPTAK